jgi:hypothetical protein
MIRASQNVLAVAGGVHESIMSSFNTGVFGNIFGS